MGAIVEHSRDGALHFAENVFLNNYECHTGRSQVFLCTTIYKVVFWYINWAREDVAWHIGNQTHIHIGVFADFGSVDSVIGCDMEIVDICRNCVVLRNVSVIGFLWRSYHIYFAKELSFLNGFARPCASVEVCGFGFEQVEGDHAELHACTTTEKQHLIAGRHVEQLLEQLGCFLYYGSKLFAAVRNLENG